MKLRQSTDQHSNSSDRRYQNRSVCSRWKTKGQVWDRETRQQLWLCPNCIDTATQARLARCVARARNYATLAAIFGGATAGSYEKVTSAAYAAQPMQVAAVRRGAAQRASTRWQGARRMIEGERYVGIWWMYYWVSRASIYRRTTDRLGVQDKT
jgi:hypothetical protein